MGVNYNVKRLAAVSIYFSVGLVIVCLFVGSYMLDADRSFSYQNTLGFPKLWETFVGKSIENENILKATSVAALVRKSQQPFPKTTKPKRTTNEPTKITKSQQPVTAANITTKSTTDHQRTRVKSQQPVPERNVTTSTNNYQKTRPKSQKPVQEKNKTNSELNKPIIRKNGLFVNFTTIKIKEVYNSTSRKNAKLYNAASVQTTMSNIVTSLQHKSSHNVTISPIVINLPKSTTKLPVYLCVNSLGRLGNQLFEVASMIGIARRYGLEPTLQNVSDLWNMFDLPYKSLDKTVYEQFDKLQSTHDCSYEAGFGNVTKSTLLLGYFQSWKYFEKIFSEIRSSFKIQTKIKETARINMMKAIREQHKNITIEKLTYVGIHVRRGDFLNKDKIEYGYKVASPKFLLKAMEFFTSRFPYVMFIVCSTDMPWVEDNIPLTNATLIRDQSAILDMTTLTLCNHTIMTVGSFGWWAAWMTRGITVYQKQQVVEGSPISTRFNIDDYMIQGWIPIDENG